MHTNFLVGVPAQELTIKQCHELAGYFYDRYAFETDDQFDLWCAGMAKYLARMAKLREVPEDKTVLEVSEVGSPFRRLAYVEFSIPGMVCQFQANEHQGHRALTQILKATGLDR